MEFTKENIKYCLLSFDQPMKEHMLSYAEQSLCISGLYQWTKIFKGDFNFPLYPEDTEQYNLMHVNITPRNIPLLDSLLPKINRTKTKLLFNVDHSTYLWMNTFNYPAQMLAALDKGDYLFAVEPMMQEILEDALKRKVACIPHPVSIESIKQHRKKERAQRIGISIHRYMGNTVLPWFAVNELKRGWGTSALGAVWDNWAPKVHHMYPEVQEYLKFELLIEHVSDMYAMIESYMLPSYGRLTIECAALAVPVIGCNIVQSQKHCFPQLCVEHFEPVKMKRLLNRLIKEPEFYAEVANHATEAAEYYNLENSEIRMLDFLNSAG